MSDRLIYANGASRTATDWSGAHLLLVEDNVDHQWLVRTLLRDSGAKIDVVELGEDALESVETSFRTGRPYDLILMDIRLPTIDGYETTRRVRGAGYTGPIVAITTGAMEKDIEECHRAGCDGYVSKPFDRATLQDAIAEFLIGRNSEE